MSNDHRMNENGENLLDFCTANHLRILNDREINDRVFTREQREKGSIEYRSRSCLDLGIADKGLQDHEFTFEIRMDHNSQVSSDHYVVNTCLHRTIYHRACPKPEAKRYEIKPGQSYEGYQEMLTKKLKSVPLEEFSNMPQKSKIDFLESTILKAASSTLKVNPTKKGFGNSRGLPRAIKGMIRLKQKIAEVVRSGHGTQSDYDNFLKIKTILARRIRDWRLTKTHRRKIKLLQSDPDRKLFWKILKAHKTKSVFMTGLRDEHGALKMHPVELARITRNAFKERLRGLDEPSTDPIPDLSQGKDGQF